MKKLIAISVIFLASVFCFTGLITYAASQNDFISLVLDVFEEESSEEENIDEKNSSEDFLSVNEKFISVISIYKNIFRNHITSDYFAPYFEISSPPPEFIM